MGPCLTESGSIYMPTQIFPQGSQKSEKFEMSNPMPRLSQVQDDVELRKYIELHMGDTESLEDYDYHDFIENILLYQRTWDAINKIIPNAKASLKNDWSTTRFLDPDFAGPKMIGRINNLQIVAALLLTISVANLFADSFDPSHAVGFPPDEEYPYDVDAINYVRGIFNFTCTIFFSCTIMFGAVFTDMMSRFYTKSEQYVAVVKYYPWSIFAINLPTWAGVTILFVTFNIEVGIRYPVKVALPLGLFGMTFFLLFVYFLLQANSTASLSQTKMYSTFTRNFCGQDGRVSPEILSFAKRESGVKDAEKAAKDRVPHVTVHPDLLHVLLRRQEQDLPTSTAEDPK